MNNQQMQVQRRHRLLMVALFFFFAGLYLFVYNGVVRFNDELQMFDITGSMVDFADEKYDISLWYVWTNYEPLGQDQTSLYPLPKSPIEPLQSLVGTPFYVAGRLLPNLGLAHTVWLSNVLICAALGVLVFQYTHILGYDTRVGLLAAFAVGICTVVFPYSKTFLREPLATLLLLLTAYFLELARTRRWYYFFGAGVAFLLAFWTK